MNLKKKKVWSKEAVKSKEYEILRCALLARKKPDVEINEQYQVELSQILEDIEYQEVAISLEKDKFGYVSMIGTVTPTLMIANFQNVDSEIMDKLLSNILLNYQDESKSIPLMFTENINHLNYLYLILAQKDLKLKKEYQLRVAWGVTRIIQKLLTKRGGELKKDFEIVSTFLFRDDIDLRFRMNVVDTLSSEHIALFYKELQCEAEEESSEKFPKIGFPFYIV